MILFFRFKTGRQIKPENCFFIELQVDAISPFQYLKSSNNESTSYQRYTNITPNDWFSEEPQSWNAIISSEKKHTEPWKFMKDRQVALVSLRNVTQGSYKCANQGKCIAPDICACSNGWIGFDCRVPVCEQGYYEPDQKSFVKGSNNEHELKKFEIFLDQNKEYRLDPAGDGYSNPTYLSVQERYRNSSYVERQKVSLGGKLYLKLDGTTQGGYECSIRSVTEWEDYRSGYLFAHPNYFSRYMDKKVEADGNEYTHWEGMGWKPTFQKTEMLEFSASSLGIDNNDLRLFVYTDKGYLRRGQWIQTNSSWSKGHCIIEFQRVCDGTKRMTDLETSDEQSTEFLVQDTDLVRDNLFSHFWGSFFLYHSNHKF